MSRMMFAVKDHFGKNNPKWPSFMSRYWATRDGSHDGGARAGMPVWVVVLLRE